MLVRIVKMTFKAECIDEFKNIFSNTKEKIRGFEGCTFLELYQDQNNPSIFFTYSYWNDETYLNTYRHSELFETVWSNTKVLFATKAEAWSVDKIETLK